MYIAASRLPQGYEIQPLDAAGRPLAEARTLDAVRTARLTQHPEHSQQIWVFDRLRYPVIELAQHGARLGKAHDLWLARRILKNSPWVPATDYTRHLRSQPEHPLAADARDRPWLPQDAAAQGSLFDDAVFSSSRSSGVPGLPQAHAAGHNAAVTLGAARVAAELRAQLETLAAVPDPAHAQKLNFLIRAESAGGLIAAELEHTGLPWDERHHLDLLAERLGPRPQEGRRPAVMEAKAQQIQQMLGVGPFNPDSPAAMLKALRQAGFSVESTRKWQLRPLAAEHPVIAEILAYKKLLRLGSANGWAWLETWVHAGRLRSEYVVGGVPSGRWVSLGGGLMQLPRELRATIRAPKGFKLVIADVSQLEPRVLAAMSQDSALAAAARGHDLYQAVADRAFKGERNHAKLAVLAAMYGATTGEGGAYVPVFAKAYPQAMALVEAAARDGEEGLSVHSHLGRGTPGGIHLEEQDLDPAFAADARQDRAEASRARARGRFTRNFVVQASAAEWALCWLGTLRRLLHERFGAEAELVYFLHDEIMVVASETIADDVARTVSEAADRATDLLFGRIPVDFPLSLAVVDQYSEAK